MKRFKFRLERVLDYRKIVEGEKKRDLMDRQRTLDAAIQRDQDLAREQLANKVAAEGVFSVDQLQMIGAYGQWLLDSRERQRQEIVEAERAVAEAQQVYIEARKDVRVLEELRTKKLQQYNGVVAQEDSKFLDELAVQRFQRN